LKSAIFGTSEVTLTLTLDRVIWHTVVHRSSTSIYTPNFIETGKTFCGRTDVHMDVLTDRHFRPPLMLLGRLRGVDLIIQIPANDLQISLY